MQIGVSSIGKSLVLGGVEIGVGGRKQRGDVGALAAV